jgi:L-ascorbate metabolism protein UlaG (beta-lactamase superfamily)
MVIIKWHGHACFELKDSEGFTVVIDPHDGSSLGLATPDVQADAILITHDHFDHNAYQVVFKPGAEIYRMKEGEFTIGGKYKAKGVMAYHDKFKGRRRGPVIMYKLEFEGLNILHVGDLGHALSSDIINMLKPVDILMVPVGGTFTLDSKEAYDLTKELKPKAVLPMHYWIPGINLPLSPVDHFLKLQEWGVIELDENEWSIMADDLNNWSETKTVVFKLF